MAICIGNNRIEKGEKFQGYFPVYETGVKLPVTVINGKKTGKTVLVTGGIHNAEYTGIETAIRLANETDIKEISGGLIIIHPVNISGFENRTMSVAAEDGKNLNRIFPGNRSGSVGEQISAWLVDEIFLQTDYYIDLHAGDGFENLMPYVYYVGAAEEEVCRTSKSMAKMVNVPYMVKSHTATGGAYNYAGTYGIPSILIERGCGGRWSEEEVEDYLLDVRNVIRYLGVLEGRWKHPEAAPVDVVDVVYENAGSTGCWYPEKKAGEFFCKGERLGSIKDYFGNHIQSCTAQYDGVILYQVSSLSVLKNDSMIAYGNIGKSTDDGCGSRR